MADRPRAGVVAVGEMTRSGELWDVFAALEALAGAAGIDVRIEPFRLEMTGKGGLCRIGNRRVILVDAKLSLLEQVGVIGVALGRAIPEDSPLRRSVDEVLEPYLRTGHSRIRPLVRPKPLARAR